MFRLHPTFKVPVVEVTKAPFKLSKCGWGSFELDVDIHWKQQSGGGGGGGGGMQHVPQAKMTRVQHELAFQTGGAWTRQPIDFGPAAAAPKAATASAEASVRRTPAPIQPVDHNSS